MGFYVGWSYVHMSLVVLALGNKGKDSLCTYGNKWTNALPFSSIGGMKQKDSLLTSQSLCFSFVFCSHLHSNSTSTLTVAISNASYPSSSPIKLLFSSNDQISSPPESSGYSEELCPFLWPIQSSNQPGKNKRKQNKHRA